MPNLQLLNPQTHGQLRLRTAAEAAPHFLQVRSPEFQVAATCCPILFTKDPETGSFYAGAMFGFKPGENLLGSPEDRGGFHPLMLQREGFFMSERNIAIDRDHARFSEQEGEPLFNEAHEPGNSLRAIQRALGEIHHGLERNKSFIAELTAHKLIRRVKLPTSWKAQKQLLGFA